MSSVQSLAYDSPWHLVALFCRVHSLPRSLTLLHELARNNDWVMFLHESDLQQCPADTVLDVVDGYFMDSSLQSHLRILAHSISAQDQNFVPGRKLKSIERGQNANDRAREEENQTEETTAPQATRDACPAEFLGAVRRIPCACFVSVSLLLCASLTLRRRVVVSLCPVAFVDRGLVIVLVSK